MGNVATIPFSTRHLGPGDEDCLRRLNDLFGEAFNETDKYQSLRPGRRYLEDFLNESHVTALVAENANGMIGGLVAYELPKLEQERSEVYIYDLAVAEDHRRQGVATALIEALRVWSAAHNAWIIYVQADYGDEPAIALYSKSGVREDVLHFDIPVGTR